MTEKKIRRLQIRLTDEVYRRLRVISHDTSCTMTEVIEGLVNDYYMASLVIEDDGSFSMAYPGQSLFEPY